MEIEVLRDTGKRTKDRNKVVLAKCHCGTEFETDASSLRRGRVKSCGCSRIKNLVGMKFNKLTVEELSNGRDGNGAVLWKCKCECGKITYLNGSELKNPRKKSCGCDKSGVIAHCKSRAGVNHHWYNKSLNDDERTRQQDIEFSRGVFVRDNYTYQKCGYRGSNLNAHHLDGYHWCKELRSDISNGSTLCETCHVKFHKLYGRTYNTRYQYYQYLGYKYE